jgi:hypothetical protein
MNCSKLIGLSFGVLTLLAIGTSEARSHVNFGFGVNIQEQPRYAYAPARYIVEEHYYPQERVVVQHDPYGRIVSEHVYVAPMPARTVYVQPAYRERVRPASRSFFSFGFFR